MNSMAHNRRQRMKWTSLSLLLAAVSGVIGILNWIMLRTLVLTLLALSPINSWSWRAIDNFSFLLFGMIWLSFVLYIQHYYLKSAEKKRLGRNAAFVTGIQLLLLLACQLPPFVSGTAQLNTSNLLILSIQCIIGLLMVIIPKLFLRNTYTKKEEEM